MKKKRIDMSDSEYTAYLWELNRPYMSRKMCMRVVIERTGSNQSTIKERLEREGIEIY